MCEGEKRECVWGIWTGRGGWCLRAVERSGQTQAAIHGQIKFMWESAPLSQPSLPSECFITSAPESARSCQSGSQQSEKRNKKNSSLPCVSSYRIEPPNPPLLNNTSAICKPDTHGSTPMSSRAAWQPKHTRVHIWAHTRICKHTHTPLIFHPGCTITDLVGSSGLQNTPHFLWRHVNVPRPGNTGM